MRQVAAVDKVTRLTGEQEAVRNLKTEGRFVVTGPPGTGKSLLAVLRASKIMAEGEDLIVLSKNVPLNSHLKESIAPALADVGTIADFTTSAAGKIRTYDSWSYGLWRKVPKAAGKQYGKGRGPMLPDNPDWGYDWETAADDILEQMGPDDARQILEIPKNVLIDEGQDLPAEFYKFLTRMNCNMTVFADENQMIYTGMSTIARIKESMSITMVNGHVYEIKKNFRNTRQVAEIAAHFYAGLATGIPEMPDKVGQKPTVAAFSDMTQLAKSIVGLAQRKRGSAAGSGPSVGVIVLHGKKKIEELQTILDQVADEIKVRRYDKDGFKENPFTFDEPESVTLVSPWTMKGLEWDHVVVLFDGFKLKGSPEELIIQKMQCYVAASRPRARLVFAWTKTYYRAGNGDAPEVLQGLLQPPYDEKIVKEFHGAN